MLGRLYAQTGAFDKAIVSLRRVVEGQPGYPEAALLLSSALDADSQPAEAIRTLEAAVEENPEYFRGHMRLAELYEKQRRFQDAADAYAHAQAANSRAELGGRQAASLINAGKPLEARDLLRAAIAKKPTPDAGLLYMLAQAQRLLKDLDGATGTAQTLKTAFPNDTRALYLEAQLLEDRGRLPEAIAAFDDSIKRAPDNGSLVIEVRQPARKGEPPGGRRAGAARSAGEGPARRQRPQFARLHVRGAR